MSIKDLFETNEDNINLLSETNQKDAFKDVESEQNLEQLKIKQDTFVPPLDYSNPVNFARYGSAYYYYKGAMERISGYYPYDGSDAEINKFYNELLDVEKYVFDNLYPRTHGYINLAVTGWGDVAAGTDLYEMQGYGTPDEKEYITFKGGPGIGGNTTNLTTMVPEDYSSKFQYSNVYDTDIYTTAGLESDYGKGTRESNLKSNFDTGVTVEFWLKKEHFAETKSTKEVVFDMWVSGALSSSADYGRLRIELSGGADVSGSPFRLTALSGTTGLSGSTIGQAATFASGTLQNWNHFAFVLYNTGSDFVSKFYFNGILNDTNIEYNVTLGELQQSETIGRIGSLLTAPSGATNYAGLNDYNGAGKLSASIDEFRFWKVARSGQDIGRYWFDQVRGGVNTDISNTTLGIYYKFNEGITGVTATDSTVLDYGGRIANGEWTGYGALSRATGSAILEAGAAIKEYKDPIVYSSHPTVAALKTSLEYSGSVHDSTNNTAFMNYNPAWIIEEHEDIGNDNLKIISHIMGSYFDRVFSLSTFLPKVKGTYYPSGSETPIPFARHLPQSLGLYMPSAFVDADVMELFLNRNDSQLFEEDVNDIRNSIYVNIYNNLTNIYKSKGTFKAIRNVFRCFNVDESLVKINTYSNNQTFELANNYEQVLEKRKLLNLDKTINREGVVYQRVDTTNNNSRGYISGSHNSGSSTTGGTNESQYGITVEADIVFPRFFYDYDYFDRKYTRVSLFGMHSVNTSSANSLSGVDTTWVDDDYANFQVYAIKSTNASRNAYFKLSCSNSPYPLPELTSSIFVNVYDNSQWNLSVRVEPAISKYGPFVSSSAAYDYNVIFEGYNVNAGLSENKFSVTGTIDHVTGSRFLTEAKRLYLGAARTNLTGALIDYSDVWPSSLRYWMKSLDNTSLEEHAYDLDNYGISGSYKNVSPLDPNDSVDILNKDTLALNWEFTNLSSSDGTGNFIVTDYSSGSVLDRNSFGWFGKTSGYQHTGYGYAFVTSSSDITVKRDINTFKFIEPERVISSDAVKVLSEDDQVFGIVETVPSYVYTIEKSMYRAISEEMLNFFAGVVDFNNLIGAPVNRYRERYKEIEHLRDSFFRRVTDVAEVEKFISYYKWFDSTIASVISQLIPASGDLVPNTYDIVESHVLERNKYQTKYPTLEDARTDIDGTITGIGQLGLSYETFSTTLPRSPRPTNEHETFWREVADRRSVEITSGDAEIDIQRNRFRDVINTSPRLNTTAPNFKNTVNNSTYKRNFYGYRNFQREYNFKVEPLRKMFGVIKGGVNFNNNKNISFTYNSLYPFSPISDTENRYVPLNVLLALESDLVKITDFLDDVELKKNIQRNIRVQFGRGYGDDGFAYTNTDSVQAFPFNIVSGAVESGYNKQIVTGLSGNVQVTNIHNDVYGPDMEVPMQGPFTNYAVGGHQSRHIAINSGSDTWQTRPEAWKLLLGECKAGTNNGAIGMVGPDYPIEALGRDPSPSTGIVTIAEGNVSAGDFVTISDGDTSVKYEVPFDNEKAVLFQDKADSWIAISGDMSASYGLPASHPLDYFYIEKGTISAWLRADRTTGTGYIFQAGGDASSTMAVGYRSDNKLTLYQQWYNADGGGIVNVDFRTDDAVITDGVWHHIAVTYDATLTGSMSPKFFVDGVLKDSSVSTAPPTAAGSRLNLKRKVDGELTANSDRVMTVIGGENGHVAVSGAIDEVSIWQVSMSANEVSELYASGAVSNLFKHSKYVSDSSNLYAWYRMGDDANDAIDGSGAYELGTNSIVDQTGRVNGNPGDVSSPAMSFTTNVVTASGVSSGTSWTLGASANASALNLQNAIINTPNFNINTSRSDNVITLTNTKYGTATSKNRNARGTLGNSTIVKSGENITVGGMSSGKDPRVMNYNVPRAVYYREETAKRPVNIRNILTTTGSTILGNYAHNYEVVNTVGAYSNPRSFIENQPEYPLAITSRPNILSGATVASSYITRFENAAAITSDAGQNHVDIPVDYTVGSGTFNKSVITSRFNAPGGPETMQRGFQDFRSSEFAIYSTNNYRNLPVLEAGFSNDSNQQTEVAGFGYIVSDIHDRPVGLRQHLTRHSGRFGRDSVIVTGTSATSDGPGASYEQKPAMFKIPRNRLRSLEITSNGSIQSGSKYDNSYVQHTIPVSDLNYSWITCSVDTVNNHFGYFPPNYLVRRGSDYVDPVTFVSASDAVSFVQSGARKFGAGKPIDAAARTQHVFTDFAGINFHIYEPIGTSASAGRASQNTTGYSASITPLYKHGASELQYTNRDIISSRAAPYNTDGKASAGIFNALILHRNGPYGWPTWKQTRAADNATMRHEIKNNYISVVTGAISDIANFSLHPVSMRGRPGIFNFNNTIDKINNTIKATANNEKIIFNEQIFNDFVGISRESLHSPFDQINDIVTNNGNYASNWILYTENIFPSEKNEFNNNVRSRVGYENYFWRSSIANRITLGEEVDTTFGFSQLDQSAWGPDAGLYFTSRTGAIDLTDAMALGNYAQQNFLASRDPSGELQNQYVHITNQPATGSISVGNKIMLLKAGVLYARKHCLTSPASTVAPSGISRSSMLINLTSSDIFNTAKQLQLFGGEAAYQSDVLAGKLVVSGTTTQWERTPTAPWFNNYDDFKYELMKVAKDYVVVPEYRISEHVSDLLNNTSNKTNWFEIPGTSQNSSNSEFYKTYTNSEFLKDFLNIKDQSRLAAKEIMIEVSAIKRFNPYKGFFPAQRTMDLAAQFKSSYLDRLYATFVNNSGTTIEKSGSEIFNLIPPAKQSSGIIRPLIQALYSPGIMYNSIKSGMAVDYAIITDHNKISYQNIYGEVDGVMDTPNLATQNYGIYPGTRILSSSLSSSGYPPIGGVADQRLPFQTILQPEKYLNNVLIADIEPHPSASLPGVRAGLIGGSSDELYTMMAQNFFGQVADFWLEGKQFTKLQSQVMPDNITVPSGSTYAARIKLKRSLNTGRIYSQESSSAGNNYGYSNIGGALWNTNDSIFDTSGSFELPQDPRQQTNLKETFTLYSRPSAFGPAFLGPRNITGESGTSNGEIQQDYHPLDSLSGYNWIYTPPYTNGEAWVDVVWTSDGTAKSVNDILTEAELIYRRCDPGYQSKLIYDPAVETVYTPYGGHNINHNAMQISASIDLLGVEEVQGFELNKDGILDKQLSTTAGSRWIIQPKFETPMMNFNDEGVNPINYDNNKTQPTFASTSTPNGMWHQFGNLPESPNKGIFMEIGDVPENWLRYHYDVVINNSAYNKYNVDGEGPFAYQNVKSLTDLFGFNKTSQQARLGQIQEEKTIREAVVAVPYIVESIEPSIERKLSKTYLKERKKFISIERYKEIVNDNSLNAAGESIRKLAQKMERYVLPPQLDFVSNPNLDPIAMYIFEFEYKLDRDDLSYIWQNIAPRNYKKTTIESVSTAHKVGENELLTSDDLSDPNTRFMVFKAKFRGMDEYDDTLVGAKQKDSSGYELSFNWPYDYVSIVELAKIEAKALFKPEEKQTKDVASSPSESGASSRQSPRSTSSNISLEENVAASNRY